MLKRSLFVVILTIILNPVLFSQSGQKKSVLIVPFQDRSAQKVKKSESASFKEMTYRSLYDFISFLPFVKSPSGKRLTMKSQTGDEANQLARSQSVDVVVFGSYSISGPESDLQVEVSFKIWSARENRLLYQEKYNTHMDLDLFDVVDEMLKKTIEKGLGLEARFAQVSVNNINIGNEMYQLNINNRMVEVISNRAFNKDYRVLAGYDYHVNLLRVKDNKVVFDSKEKLSEGDILNVSYDAKAHLKLSRVMYGEKGNKYTIQFDGDEVSENSVISNVGIKIDQSILILDQNSIIQQKIPLDLKDGEQSRAFLAPNWGGAPHLRFFTMGGNQAGIGFDWYLSRPLWVGGAVGVSFLNRQVDTNEVFMAQINPSLQAGYHFLGHMNRDFRLGAGLEMGLNIVAPSDTWTLISGNAGIGFIPAAFADLEWKFLYIRLKFIYNLSEPQGVFFRPELGLKF